MAEIWAYRIVTWVEEDPDLTGYEVESNDGHKIGKVDEATSEAGGSYIVVDTGFWIFGKKRLIPAGAVSSVDHENRKIVVNLSKDEVKNAPDYDEATWNDDERERTSDYYGPYAA
jgi:hypothetical protein